jgi:hypothetical protein
MGTSKLSSPLDPLLASLAHFTSSSDLTHKVRPRRRAAGRLRTAGGLAARAALRLPPRIKGSAHIEPGLLAGQQTGRSVGFSRLVHELFVTRIEGGAPAGSRRPRVCRHGGLCWASGRQLRQGCGSLASSRPCQPGQAVCVCVCVRARARVCMLIPSSTCMCVSVSVSASVSVRACVRAFVRAHTLKPLVF